MADQPAVMEFVLAGIDAYREWAPDWRPIPPAPETRERLAGLYGDDEKAWALMALAGDDIVGLISLSVTTGADARASRAQGPCSRSRGRRRAPRIEDCQVARTGRSPSPRPR